MGVDSPYNRRRVRQGIGLLVALWAAALLFMTSTGVALSVPPAEGGYLLGADRVEGETFRLYAGYTDSTEDERLNAAVNEIGAVDQTNLRITKRLALDGLPSVNGYLRMGISADSGGADSGTLTLKAQKIVADQVRLRGSVIDEDYGVGVSDRFVIYAGDNPGSVVERDVNIEPAGSEAAFEAVNLRTRAYYVNADNIQLSNLNLIVSYDPDGDGTYEYGVS